MIDTHTHLTDEPLFSALAGVLARAREKGVVRFIVPGYDPVSWAKAREMARRYAEIQLAVGMHPMFARDENLASLENEIGLGGIVAVGEIGLDYVHPDADRELQKRLLRRQMALAREANLPVILHCRRAHDDLLDICREYPGIRGVLHSCSCSHEQVKPFVALGFHVGFSGVVTRKRAKKVKKLATAVTLGRILTETDSPFIGTDSHPVPSVEPAQVAEVVAALASLRGIPAESMARTTSENAARLFGEL